MNTHDSSQPDPALPFDDGVERLLAAFTPRPARLDRDRLMFLAGQAAAGAPVVVPTPTTTRVPWYWPASTAVASLCSAVLATIVFVQASTSPKDGLLSTVSRTPATTQVIPSPAGPSPTAAASGTPVQVAPESPQKNFPSNSSLTFVPRGPELRGREIAQHGYLTMRDAAVRDQLEDPIPMPSTRDDTDLPSSYFRAVRSVIDRPQLLMSGLRY